MTDSPGVPQVPEGWDVWDPWDTHSDPKFDVANLSPQPRYQIVERRCSGMIDRLGQQERRLITVSCGTKTKDTEERHHILQMVCATIVVIQCHLSGDLLPSDLGYVSTAWSHLTSKLIWDTADPMLQRDLLDLLAAMSSDYDAFHRNTDDD